MARDFSFFHIFCVCKTLVLTIAAHADGDALLQATILTAVAIDAQNAALLVLRARAILDFLLDGAPEEALHNNKMKQERR